MFEKYGIVTIKKDSKLYVASETNNFLESWRYHISPDKHNEHNKNKNIPIIYLSFHPSEFELYRKYVVKLKLNRDIKLLFLLENKIGCHKKIYSIIDNIINCKRNFQRRILDKSLKDISKLLEKHKFDGYFSTQLHGNKRNKNIEIGLINNLNTYSIIKTSKLKKKWRETYIMPNYTRIKKWDNKYKICSIKQPISFYLNRQYKNFIKSYIQKINIKIPFEFIEYTPDIYTFDIILQNAIIKYYHDEINIIENNIIEDNIIEDNIIEDNIIEDK